MARFRATVQGSRGMASRLGHRAINADVNGWQYGVNVFGFDSQGHDAFAISLTRGSSGGTVKTIGHVTETGFEASRGVRQQVIDEYLELDINKVDSAGQVWSGRLGRYLPYSFTRIREAGK